MQHTLAWRESQNRLHCSRRSSKHEICVYLCCSLAFIIYKGGGYL